MRGWLEQPVTRGEVLGWTLAVPAVLYVAVLGSTAVDLLGLSRHEAALDPGLVPTFLAVCLSLGEVGLAGVFVFCAVLALGAQLTRQRAWMRVAAPLVSVLLAHAVAVRLQATQLEHMTYVSAQAGERLAAVLAEREARQQAQVPEEER